RPPCTPCIAWHCGWRSGGTSTISARNRGAAPPGHSSRFSGRSSPGRSTSSRSSTSNSGLRRTKLRAEGMPTRPADPEGPGRPLPRRGTATSRSLAPFPLLVDLEILPVHLDRPHLGHGVAVDLHGEVERAADERVGHLSACVLDD